MCKSKLIKSAIERQSSSLENEVIENDMIENGEEEDYDNLEDSSPFLENTFEADTIGQDIDNTNIEGDIQNVEEDIEQLEEQEDFDEGNDKECLEEEDSQFEFTNRRQIPKIFGKIPSDGSPV